MSESRSYANQAGFGEARVAGGVNALFMAPYGYRYIRKQDGAPAQYVIDLSRAATVRKVFHWIGVDRLSIGEAVRRLDETGIEIPVPPIGSEALFLALQEQQDENRRYARQRCLGATFLLQGLAVCGHCHYAYNGKKVS